MIISAIVPIRKIVIALGLLGGVLLAGGGVVMWRVLPVSDDTSMKIVVPDTHYTPLAAPPPASTTTTIPSPTTTTTSPPAPSAKSGTKPRPASASTTKRAADSSIAGQLLALVNEQRATAGCHALSLDGRLAAAQGHSDDMSARNYFSHDTPSGVGFAQRIEAAGYPSPAAENIAKGSTTVAQTMDLWMNSDGHRRNILNCSYTKLGVGLARAGWYWTQDFGF